MLFNSYAFIFIFLPAVFLLFRLAATLKLKVGTTVILVLGSLIFYGYWNPKYVFLIVASIGFNFSVGRAILNGKGGSIPLLLGLLINLTAIGFFKYFNFFMENTYWLLGGEWQDWKIFLPLGISFFTFQQIAYLVDCHQNKIQEHGFLDYALFVSFFPQLIAGPIVHHSKILPQLKAPDAAQLKFDNLSKGFTLFTLGLFKKVAIADNLSPIVAFVFDGNSAPSTLVAWTGALAFTFQIYFDFSGYSEMALGLSRAFNIKLPLNFDAPYKATSIVDFWRRWHITLSEFLKDYLYIPLGGNRKGKYRRYANLMITMLIGGLWHGASWTFVLWGVLHGLYLCINHAGTMIFNRLNVKLPRIAGWVLTFFGVVIAWVLFRAASIAQAINIYKGMLGLNRKIGDFSKLTGVIDFGWEPVFAGWEQVACILFLCTITAFFLPSVWQFGQRNDLYKSKLLAVLMVAIFSISVLSLTNVSEFLYFQF